MFEAAGIHCFFCMCQIGTHNASYLDFLLLALRAGSAPGADDTDMEGAVAVPTHARRTDAEERQWLGLEEIVAELVTW